MTKYKIISADSHVIEPPNLWVDYIEPAFKKRAPHTEREGEHDVFKCDGGITLIQPGAVSGAGKPSEQLKNFGSYDRDVPPGSYDPKARVKEIAVDGVEAEVLYPSIALRMFQIADMPYQVACFKAYNSWLSDFCKVDPNRFKGIGVVPIDDIEAAVGEIHRCRKIGLAGVSISVNPVDEEGYDNPRFEPLWRAAQDQGMPVSLHILTERRSTLKPGMDFIVQQVLDPGAIQAAFTRMIFSGVFDKFPRLKVVSAENDIGWSGYFVERIDYLFERRKAFHKWVIKRQPSEFFHEHCYLTFMRDRSGILVRGIAGVDNIMWSSDYPHLDSTYPKSQQLIESMMGDIPAADRRKIVCENAAKLYGFN